MNSEFDKLKTDRQHREELQQRDDEDREKWARHEKAVEQHSLSVAKEKSDAVVKTLNELINSYHGYKKGVLNWLTGVKEHYRFEVRTELPCWSLIQVSDIYSSSGGYDRTEVTTILTVTVDSNWDMIDRRFSSWFELEKTNGITLEKRTLLDRKPHHYNYIPIRASIGFIRSLVGVLSILHPVVSVGQNMTHKEFEEHFEAYKWGIRKEFSPYSNHWVGDYYTDIIRRSD